MSLAVIWSLSYFQTFFFSAFALLCTILISITSLSTIFHYCTVETSIDEEILVEFYLI